MSVPPPLLEARALGRRFALPRRMPFEPRRWRQAVAGVDLRIAPGEAVGLVGESGCGKSTLARLLARLIDPDAGELWLQGARIDEIPAARFSRSPARRLIQMMFQDAGESLPPRLRAEAAIADPLRMLLPEAPATEVRAQVLAAAQAVGLPPALLGRLPHRLSGGEKARVALARAIAPGPQLLVLDEPTASLDVSAQVVVLQLLEELRRTRGLALLLATHDLHLVRLLCPRMLVMHAGRIVEAGPTAQLLSAPAHPRTRALVRAAGLECSSLLAAPHARAQAQRDTFADGEPAAQTRSSSL